jgi:hypothetical protein
MKPYLKRRRSKVFNLRNSGATWPSIAKETGVGLGTVRNDFRVHERALERLSEPAHWTDGIESIRIHNALVNHNMTCREDVLRCFESGEINRWKGTGPKCREIIRKWLGL